MISIKIQKNPLFAAYGILPPLAIALLSSYPALYGIFYLDDWPNLAGLENVHNSLGFWLYVFDGVSSVLGRQVSLVTFALQASAWPDNPFPFKLVNLIIHLVNGVLAYVVCGQLLALLGKSGRERTFLSCATTTLWLIAPIQVYTVFYVVQRMVLLSATFTLLGILGYIKAQPLIEKKRFVSGYLLITLSLCGALIFGVLSKENAILLTVYILVIEGTFGGTLNRYKSWRIWKLVVLWGPIVLLTVYLAWNQRYLSGYSLRDFTPAERLLTETRILWDYFRLIVFPVPGGYGLFHDDYVVSRGLFDPPSTFFAILGLLTTVVTAFIFRGKYPVYAFGVLWFLGGHLLESTILGLELYFDHRNYLPSLGFFFAIPILVMWAYKSASRRAVKNAVVAGFCFYIFGTVLIQHLEVRTMGAPEEYAFNQVRKHPRSLRARQQATSYFANTGQYAKAAYLLHTISQDWKGDVGSQVQLLLLHCLDANVVPPKQEDFQSLLQSGRFDRGTVDAMNEIVKLKTAKGCAHVKFDYLREILDNVLSNRNFSRQTNDFLTLNAKTFQAEGQYKKAHQALEKVSNSTTDIPVLILRLQYMLAAKSYGEASDFLKIVRTNAEKTIVYKTTFSEYLDRVDAYLRKETSI